MSLPEIMAVDFVETPTGRIKICVTLNSDHFTTHFPESFVGPCWWGNIEFECKDWIVFWISSTHLRGDKFHIPPRSLTARP